MGSLQEQLLKAGLISAEQLEQSQTKKSHGPGGRNRGKGQGRNDGSRRGASDKAGAAAANADAHGRRSDSPPGAGKSPQDRNQHDRNQKGRGRSRPAGEKRKLTDAELSLEEAYRARQQLERDEEQRTRVRQQREQEARRQRNLKLDEIVKDQIRNDSDADVRRYFEYGGRIRHLYVTATQLQALAERQLGIAVLRGRYLLLEPEALAQFAAEAPDLVPDLSKEATPEQIEASTDVPDVPDDLRW